MSKIVNKVKVVKAFPGFEVGDILTLNTTTGLFEYSYEYDSAKQADALDEVDRLFLSYHSSISKSVVLNNLNEYFIDLSTYSMQPTSAIEGRIASFYKAIEEAKAELADLNKAEPEENDEFNDYVDSRTIELEESITVWQNIIWFGEWVLGKRTSF